MGTAKVTIAWQGIDEVIANLGNIEQRALSNLQSLTKELANDTEEAWKQATPEGKTGKLRGSDVAEPEGLSFTLQNATYYYKFVDTGHWTPRGWRIRSIKHGWVYRFAKRRSHVAGREMTSKALEFVRGNIEGYLSRFLQ